MIARVLTVLAASCLPSLALAQGPEPLPYEKVQVEASGIEVPVPVYWVDLPAGGQTGADALWVSVQDKAELDVFSVPFQSDFHETTLEARAAEIRDFVSPSGEWDVRKTEMVEVGGTPGIRVLARWERSDMPADVLVLSFPTRGRTVLVLLVMARMEGSIFEQMAALLSRHITIVEPPVEVDGPSAKPWVHTDGRGFSITVPAGWRRVADAEVQEIGARSGAGDQPPTGATLGFVLPGILRQSPNVIVDVTPSSIEPTEGMLDEIESMYRSMTGGRESPFTIDRASMVEVADRDAILVEGRVETLFADIRQRQYLVPMDEHTLMLTFSVPASLQDRRAGDVASMVRSVEITSAPAGATGDADPRGDASGEPVASRYWGIAVVVGALVLVALVLVLRRRKR